MDEVIDNLAVIAGIGSVVHGMIVTIASEIVETFEISSNLSRAV